MFFAVIWIYKVQNNNKSGLEALKGLVYSIIIFCVLTLSPLINRNTYTPRV